MRCLSRGKIASAAAWAEAGSGRKPKSMNGSPTSEWNRPSGLGLRSWLPSCPYCITALEDSRLVMNHADDIQVKDITEILQEVI